MKNVVWVSVPSEKYNENGQLVGFNKVKGMGMEELEQFIINQLFPISIVPPLAYKYLKYKHLRTIKLIREYVARNILATKENPAKISELEDVLATALVKNNVNINELRSYTEEEVINWQVAKSNDDLDIFGNIKKR